MSIEYRRFNHITIAVPAGGARQGESFLRRRAWSEGSGAS
jgi:hypothetical protein